MLFVFYLANKLSSVLFVHSGVSMLWRTTLHNIEIPEWIQIKVGTVDYVHIVCA